MYQSRSLIFEKLNMEKLFFYNTCLFDVFIFKNSLRINIKKFFHIFSSTNFCKFFLNFHHRIDWSSVSMTSVATRWTIPLFKSLIASSRTSEPCTPICFLIHLKKRSVFHCLFNNAALAVTNVIAFRMCNYGTYPLSCMENKSSTYI